MVVLRSRLTLAQNPAPNACCKAASPRLGDRRDSSGAKGPVLRQQVVEPGLKYIRRPVKAYLYSGTCRDGRLSTVSKRYACSGSGRTRHGKEEWESNTYEFRQGAGEE